MRGGVSLAGSDRFSFEWFEKPPGHGSPTDDHENEQVCPCLAGELAVATEDEVTLTEYDPVLPESPVPHRVQSTGDETAVGLDVFAPGRSFDFWTESSEVPHTHRRGRPAAGGRRGVRPALFGGSGAR